MNAINIIYPHKLYSNWCFTDESVGLKEEPFVLGASEVIDWMIREFKIQDKIKEEEGIKLTFSQTPFPNFDIKAVHAESDEFSVGNWYYLDNPIIKDFKFWLCPALMLYFDQAPKEIYVKVEPLNN